MEYAPGEAREWARAHLRGVCGCLLPTLSSSLRAVNEHAIRHDVRREAELGFWGTLLVSECGTTPEEMRTVVDVAVDEASKVGLRTVLLASAPTLDDVIDLVRYGEHAGVDLVLLPYPLLFYPTSEQEVYDFTRAVADATDLGLMLFCIDQWNFGRLHPSGFSPQLIGRLIDDLPNVVAVKNEIGGPGVGGPAEVFARYGDRVVVTDPFEHNMPAWVLGFDMAFLGTSNYEYFGDVVPRCLELLRARDVDAAMELFWQVQPARKANAELNGSVMVGGGLVHRLLWKYEYWLNGFNGGPIRQPHLRLNDAQMQRLRRALVASGIQPADGDDHEFFVGRHPMD